MSLYRDNSAVRSAEWLVENIDTVQSDDADYRLVEVDMDPASYDDWHVPGAVQIDWEADLVDELGGDLVAPEELASTLGELGIEPDTEVILYGDRANWFAGHAFWVLRYYRHGNVSLLDGGRRYWRLEGFETTDTEPEYTTRSYTVTGRDESVRAYTDGVREAAESDQPIVDVRNPQEYRGEEPPAEIPNTTERQGHVPSADNVPWGEAVSADGTFKPEAELREIYGDYLGETETVAYCRIGERSSITWFVLSELLGTDAANYDGSWTEWAAADTPVARGDTAEPSGGEE